MNFVVSTTLSYILIYEYLALFVVSFLASFALPLPAITSLVAMSVLASGGYASLPFTLLASFGGFVLGDLLAYFLAKEYGEEVFSFIGLRRIRKNHYYLATESYFKRYVGLVIFASRFLTAAGPIVNVLSGLEKVPFKKYIFWDVLGEAVDVLLFGLLGYFFASQF